MQVRNGGTFYPELILTGKILERAGITPGDSVTITQIDDILTIQKSN